MVGKADFRAVIDETASEAERLITVLRAHTGGTVDLSQPAPPVNAKRGANGGASSGAKNWRSKAGRNPHDPARRYD